MRLLLLGLMLPLFSLSQSFSKQEVQRYLKQAKRVTIIRDIWGIAHIYGKTDADAVFGALYAQCEENFPRVERNYLEIMGRLSETEGKDQLLNDLQMRLIYDSAAAKKDYKNSPIWLQKLLNAFADGINYYLYTHTNVHPMVLKHFENWFPLMYTDGSIAPTQLGGLVAQDVKNLYVATDDLTYAEKKIPFFDQDPGGSNGFAIAPSKTLSGRAILYINPHVTFYFRSEMHMVSEEGLNAYGAVTWGQFFIYQGFNQHCGWMHTSSYADVADLYREKIEKKGDSLFYQYNDRLIPVKQKEIIIYYKSANEEKQKTFTVYATHHGPVMGSRDGQWLSLKENNRSLKALMQSWLRTKANGFADFKSVMDMRSNNSNNTVFADDKGNIAYWHGNFMPRRNPAYNWNLPVDGSTSATEWKGIHGLNEMIHIYNPVSGWIENCNSTPFTASGKSSPKKQDYPSYMAPDGQNPRAVNAIRLLSKARDLTIDKVIHDIGYSHYLSAFDILLPPLFTSFDSLSRSEPLRTELITPIDSLKNWNRSSSVSSIATTIAIEWAYRLAQNIPIPKTPDQASNGIGQLDSMVSTISSLEKLHLLAETVKDLENRFGTWKTPWGQVNRYQRFNFGETFSDHNPSMEVGLAAATWGSIPSFATRRFATTDKRYGLSGNSFIACVEFGPRIKAKTIITGGQSFDPESKHYLDQAERYINGDFKEIYFYKEQVLKNKERQYHPGE